MKHNKVSELLLRECPKCGKFVPGGEKECPECGAISAKLQWTPVEIEDPEQADVLAENREVALSYADRSADIISKAFPGIKIPPKEDEEATKRKWINPWTAYWGTQAIGYTLILIGMIGGDNPTLYWLIVIGIFVAVCSTCIWIYIQKQDKAERALNNGGTYNAIVVAAGGMVVQYQQRFRRMKVLTDIEGRAVIMEVLVNYVPDEMCESFYPIGKEVSLIGKKDYFAVLLEK